MNILLLIDSMKVGGTQTYLLKLTKGLPAKDHKVILAANQGEFVNRIPDHISYRQIMIEGKNPFRLWQSISKLRTLVKNEGIQIIQSHGLVPSILARIAISSLGKRIPLVTRVGKMWEKESSRSIRLLSPVIYFLIKFIADTVITITYISRDRFIRARPRNKPVKLIFNGIAMLPLKIGADKQAKQHIDLSSTATIISVGRLVEQKRIDLLLEGVSRLPPHLDIRCQIVGDGHLRKNLESQAADLSIQEQIDFLGYRRDIPKLLEAAHLFVITSAWEGTAHSTLEALQQGLPIVGFDSPGVNKVIEHGTNGLLVPFGDTKALAGAIEQVLTDEALHQRFREGAHKILEARFRLDMMVTKTVNVYQEAVNRAGLRMNS